MLTPAQAPLCACGCGKPVGVAKFTDRKNGYIKGQPFTYLRGHAPRTTKPEYLVVETGCWEWQRSCGADGYGRLATKGRRLLAHRYIYEREVGPIPDGLQLDHLCRNRRCVNPAHLEPVTNRENGRRGQQTKLSPEDIVAIRESTDTPANIALHFGVARSHVYNIRRAIIWEDVAC